MIKLTLMKKQGRMKMKKKKNMKVKQHQPSLLVFKMHQQHAILKIILQRLQSLTMLLASAYLTNYVVDYYKNHS